jgi:hypothetical protein
VYSEIALSQKQFGIGHMYIYTFFLRMTDNMTSHNTDLSSWDILHSEVSKLVLQTELWCLSKYFDPFRFYKKVKLFKQHARKTCRGVEAGLYVFFTSVIHARAHAPHRHRGKNPDTH